MKVFFVAILLLAHLIFSLSVQAAYNIIQQSHTDTNVPETFEQFNEILKKDLTQYFKEQLQTEINVDYIFLNNSPAQSGVALPKFYLWVSITNNKQSILSGAAVISVMSKNKVAILRFISQQEIIKAPQSIDNIFPEIICDEIRLKAGLHE